MKIIGLITDFGNRGYHYVAAMKNVIKSIDAEVDIVDINHYIKPFSISEASFILYYALLDMPKDSIIIVVVDPGVGSKRKVIAALTSDDRIIICPDNGIISLVTSTTMVKKIYEINNSNLYYKGRTKNRRISSTFHGRDVMAPVATKLLSGLNLSDVGKSLSVSEIVIDRDILGAEFEENQIHFMVLYIDQFGNIITNIRIKDIDKENYLNDFQMEIDNRVYGLRIYDTFDSIPDNKFGLIAGSSNYFEICLKNNSASNILNVESGKKLIFKIIK